MNSSTQPLLSTYQIMTLAGTRHRNRCNPSPRNHSLYWDNPVNSIDSQDHLYSHEPRICPETDPGNITTCLLRQRRHRTTNNNGSQRIERVHHGLERVR